jgi:hypothetical protein
MATENYINGYNVNVATTIVSGPTLFVTAVAPVASGFRILIDSELMLVTAGGTTTTWTVTRGIEGTVQATHYTGAPIAVILTAGAIDALRAQICQTGLAVSLPSSGMKAGDQYWCTDTVNTYVYNGTTWVIFPRGSSGANKNLATCFVATAESTNNTSYIDLATVDSITFTLSTTASVLIEYKFQIWNNSSGYTPWNSVVVDGIVVLNSPIASPYSNSLGAAAPWWLPYLAVNLAAGSHTVKVQHRTDGGNGYQWSNRLLTAVLA